MGESGDLHLVKRIIKISWKDEKKKVESDDLCLAVTLSRKNKEILRKGREKRHFNACS